MIRDAVVDDLPAVVDIYNASIPGRMATADLAPVTVAQRRPWFDDHDPRAWPLWVDEEGGALRGWLGLQPFRRRAAYDVTAEVSVYVAPEAHRRGVAAALLGFALARAPSLGKTALLGLVFAHNAPSVQLFERAGFARWGHLPRIAVLDGEARDLLMLGRHLGAGGQG